MHLANDTTDTTGSASYQFISYASFAYALLILYGSLFPFNDWTYPQLPLYTFLSVRPSLERADLVQNVLVYAPLGLLLVLRLNRGMRFWSAVIVASVVGSLLSFTVESIQQFLPSRVASLSDLAMNFLGSFLGGVFAIFMSPETLTGKKLLAYRNLWLRAGALANVGIAVLAIWVLSQTSPLVPSLDFAHMRHGLALLKHAFLYPESFSYAKLATYSLYLLGLGLLTVTIVRRDKPALLVFVALVGFVLCCKVVIVNRQLALEALLGAVVALVLLLPLRYLSARLMAATGIMLILAGFTVFELAPVDGGFSYPFNWIPFVGQMSSLSGLENILELLWPFMALAYFTRYSVPFFRHTEAAFFGGLAVLAIIFCEEWYQQFVPGRYGDITQVMLGFAGWVLPWCIGSAEDIADAEVVKPRRRRRSHG
ncbi:MAG: VanZ family protein, partial [Pseudomonadota bacterium]